MSRESFLRIANYINNRYPNADDIFKAEKVLFLLKSRSSHRKVSKLEDEYKILSKRFEEGTIDDKGMERMSELEHSLNLEYEG